MLLSYKWSEFKHFFALLFVKTKGSQYLVEWAAAPGDPVCALQYRKVLQAHSRQRLDLIAWKTNEGDNVDVLNKTIDPYSYFGAPQKEEFLYECVQQTVEKTLPEEVAYLGRHDRIKTFIEERFDMPERMVELLITFMRQGKDKLSQRAMGQEFQALLGHKIEMLEKAYGEIFEIEGS